MLKDLLKPMPDDEASAYFEGTNVIIDFRDCLIGFFQETNYLTLDEMFQIYLYNASYENERNEYKIDLLCTADGVKHLVQHPKWFSPRFSLLYRHIIAEQLFRTNYTTIDWMKEHGDNPFVLAELLWLWMNPLAWQEPCKCKDYVVIGKVAAEKRCAERVQQVTAIYNHIMQLTILQFADNPKVCETEDLEIGDIKGLHIWNVITRDNSMIEGVIHGEKCKDYTIKERNQYDAFCLRNNLSLIACLRGGKRAAELLRMLQTEWPTIKNYKFRFGKTKMEKIMDFENALNIGCMDLLRNWESSTTPPSNLPPIPQPDTTQMPPAHGPVYYNNCTFNDCNNTTNIGTQNNYAQPPSSPSPDESSESSTSKRGRKVKPLFIDDKGLEDIQRTEEERNRFINYLKDHDLSQRLLDSSKENLIHKAIVCFCKKWKQLRYIKGDISASAVFRFLTVTCELHCDTVEERGISNVLAQMLKSKEDQSTYYDVKDYF